MSVENNNTDSGSYVPNQMQKHLFTVHIDEFEGWLRTAGKEGNGRLGKRKPLAEDTCENMVYRIRAIFRRLWEEHGFVSELTHGLATEYLLSLDGDDILKSCGDPYSDSSKNKQELTIRKYFEWRTIEFDADNWDSPIKFKDDSYRNRDYFTIEERAHLRRSSMEIRNLPGYKDVTPEERDRWKSYLAMRLDMPKQDIRPSDWERYRHSWEHPSLVMTALDCGLRACEVSRAKVSWFNHDKGALLIPIEDSSKNEDYWEVSLRRQTIEAVNEWLKQRENYEKYDGQEEIWLTRHGNPYSSRALNYLLRRLMDEANIDYEKRSDLTWTAIRRSTATHITTKKTIAEAADQLRHKSHRTTRRYVHSSVEERRNIIEDI